MKKMVDDLRLMVKVCDMYYNDGLGQQQISEQLNISRPTVSRLLSSAPEQGIVTISVSHLDTIRHWELSRQLKEMYELSDVLIVDSLSDSEELKASLGKAAGKYLSHRIRDGHRVGISMGSTLLHVVSGLTSPAAKNITVIPLLGGMGRLRTELHANHLAQLLANAYGGNYLSLYAPARVYGAAVRNALLKEDSIASVLRLQEHLDVAVVGIGYPNENSAIKATGYYKENEIDALIDRQVAGEINMQFYDIDGDTAPYRASNTIIGLDLAKLKRVPCSIGVAGGLDKLSAIRGAISGRYINVLITDYACAKALLNVRKDHL